MVRDIAHIDCALSSHPPNLQTVDIMHNPKQLLYLAASVRIGTLKLHMLGVFKYIVDRGKVLYPYFLRPINSADPSDPLVSRRDIVTDLDDDIRRSTRNASNPVTTCQQSFSTRGTHLMSPSSSTSISKQNALVPMSLRCLFDTELRIELTICTAVSTCGPLNLGMGGSTSSPSHGSSSLAVKDYSAGGSTLLKCVTCTRITGSLSDFPVHTAVSRVQQSLSATH